MIKTTFEFLAMFAILTGAFHLLLLFPKLRTRGFWFLAEWVAVAAIGVGFIIAVAEVRGLTERRRLQDLDAYMQIRASNARGRAQDMVSYCRKLVEISGSVAPASASQFEEAERWALAAQEALRPRYETNQWREFLQKNAKVKATEDPVIQQLKLTILTLLAEMENGSRLLQEHSKELNRRGQLLWLAPASPWLLVFGFALRITQVSARWRMSDKRLQQQGEVRA